MSTKDGSLSACIEKETFIIDADNDVGDSVGIVVGEVGDDDGILLGQTKK